MQFNSRCWHSYALSGSAGRFLLSLPFLLLAWCLLASSCIASACRTASLSLCVSTLPSLCLCLCPSLPHTHTPTDTHIVLESMLKQTPHPKGHTYTQATRSQYSVPAPKNGHIALGYLHSGHNLLLILFFNVCGCFCLPIFLHYVHA